MATRTKTTSDDRSTRSSIENSPDTASVETPEPIVDLDESARETVRFQGRLYEMRSLDDFGIIEQQALTRDGREFFRLWSSDAELNRTQRQRLEMLLGRMFEKILDAPDDVKRQLPDSKRAQVVLAFTLAPLARRTAELKAQATAEQSEEARDGSTSAS